VAPDPTPWLALFAKVTAMEWRSFSPDALLSIKSPVLIAGAGHDCFTVEHALEMCRLIPNGATRHHPRRQPLRAVYGPREVLPIVALFSTSLCRTYRLDGNDRLPSAR
jgi:hypothetical protein